MQGYARKIDIKPINMVANRMGSLRNFKDKGTKYKTVAFI